MDLIFLLNYDIQIIKKATVSFFNVFSIDKKHKEYLNNINFPKIYFNKDFSYKNSFLNGNNNQNYETIDKFLLKQVEINLSQS